MLLREVNRLEELERLEPDWWDLWKRCPQDTPFQSPAWLLPWWRNFGPEAGELCAITLRRKHQLAGLAAFFVIGRVAAERNLLLLGAGNTDYLDVLLAEDAADEGVPLLLDFIGRQRHRWSHCYLENLPGTSPLLRTAIPRAATSGEVCPVLHLPTSLPDLAGILPGGQLKKYRYARRRLERMGNLQVQLVSANSLEHFLHTLFHLHTRRWRQRELAGVLAENTVQQFHHDTAAQLLKSGMLRLLLLQLEHQPLAGLYALARGETFYYYLGGFAPEWSTYSPGMVLLGRAIELAVEEGARQFNFLRGREPYKYSWGAVDTPLYRLHLPASCGPPQREAA